MDKELTVPKWAKNTPNASKNFNPKCLLKPKSSRFLKKSLFGQSVVCDMYYLKEDIAFHEWKILTLDLLMGSQAFWLILHNIGAFHLNRYKLCQFSLKFTNAITISIQRNERFHWYVVILFFQILSDQKNRSCLYSLLSWKHGVLRFSFETKNSLFFINPLESKSKLRTHANSLILFCPNSYPNIGNIKYIFLKIVFYLKNAQFLTGNTPNTPIHSIHLPNLANYLGYLKRS